MIRAFASHPTAANLLMLALAAMGILTIRDLRRETFPDYASSEVEVRMIYPGATAEEVEEAICLRLEDALDGIRYVGELRSEAREGMGVVTVEMTDAGDFAVFMDDIRTEVDAISDFPDAAEDPVIRELGTKDPVLQLLVAGPMSPADLKAYCEDLKERMLQLEGISLVDVQGFSEHQLRIELEEEVLQSLGLSVALVADRVAGQSIDVPAGVLYTPERDLLVRFEEQRRTARELEDLVILGAEEGAEIRLSDIGRVIDLFENAEESIVLGDQRAGMLQVQKTKAEDTIRIADTVKAFVEAEREVQPPGIELVVTNDLSVITRDRMEMLLKNGGQGLILVFLTMWLFFNLRLSFWVAVGLPVSFLGAFYFLPALDLTINMLTMVGLLLGLGLLMDDAIVIAENVATHWRSGKGAVQAAIDGTEEVKWGVMSSFLTTVCVLGPLVWITGDIGKVLRVVPMILILVLAVSLIEAYLILPAHLGHSLSHEDPQARRAFRKRMDSALDWAREVLMRGLVEGAIRWRYLTVGIVIGVFLLSVGLLRGRVIQFQAFPDLEGDVIMARLLMPQGTPLERTAEVVDRLRAGLAVVDDEHSPAQGEGRRLVQTVNVQFAQNADAFETGAHVATVTVDLLSAEVRTGRIDDFLADWRAAVGDVPDVLSIVYTEPSFGPAGRPIEVRLLGSDLEQLHAAAEETQAWFASHQGVRNLSHDLRPGKEELRVRLLPGTLGLGFDVGSLAHQLRAAYQGATADEIQVGAESYEIDVRLSPGGRDGIGDLEDFHFTLPDGSQVPLHAVAVLDRGRGWARIARFDRRRAVTVRGDVDTRLANTAQLLGQMRAEFLPDLAEAYPGISIELAGEIEEAGTTQASMVRALLVGLLGVFALLSFQFKSYIEPLIVMVAIPLALVGVIWAHLLLAVDLSMPSMLGFISLSGIVVNDSILLMLFLKQRRIEGADPAAAASQASRQRFRAVVLTSATTVAGLLPLLAEKSLQAQILIPLATSIVGGILASTVLVLIVIPCLYVILADLGLLARLEE